MSSPTYGDRLLDTTISDALTDLALDLRWSFNHAADRLWEQLDPELWELTHNPWVVLQTVSREKLRSVTADPNFQLWIRAWQVQVGRTKLYLLDTNVPANPPEYRAITTELYGGGPELRLKQELVLGIGGWRLLRALGLQPEVCHLNEGHAAFGLLERAASYMEDNRQPFEIGRAHV